MLGSIIAITIAIAIWFPFINCNVITTDTSNRVIAIEDCKLPQLTRKHTNSGIYYYPNNIENTNNIEIKEGVSTIFYDPSFWGFMVREKALQYLKSEVINLKVQTYNRISYYNRKETVSVISQGIHKNILIDPLKASCYNSTPTIKKGFDVNAIMESLRLQLEPNKLGKGIHYSVVQSMEPILYKTSAHHNQLLMIKNLRNCWNNYSDFSSEEDKSYNNTTIGFRNGFMRFPTIKEFRVSSNFNPRRINPVTGRLVPHQGVDFIVPIGTPVLAVGDGEVLISQNGGAAGNYVAIRHDNQYVTRYMHLKNLLVKPGQQVKRGDRIALSGNTGRSTGPHLHFEVWINHNPVDPLTVKLPNTEWLNSNNSLDYLILVKQYRIHR